MSERLTEEDLEEMRLKKKWGYGDHPPVLPVTKDIHFLFTQIAALRARAERMERIVETAQRMKRERGGDGITIAYTMAEREMFDALAALNRTEGQEEEKP